MMLSLRKNSLTLGSAQFGMDYGITNVKGKVDSEEAIQIIRHAIVQGIEYIDTAAAYGDSEKVIGKALCGNWGDRVKIITKLLPFNNKQNNDYYKCLVSKSVLDSYTNFNRRIIDTMMLHRAQHLNNPIIIDELLKLKDKEFFKNIGVSVQDPQELEHALKADYVSVIQMPLNILDNRWDDFIYNIKKVKKKRVLKIHARSVFLQGLLIDNNKSNWSKANVKNFSKIKDWKLKIMADYNRNSVKDLCISYVNGLSWVDSMVIGVESLEHLNEIFLLLNNEPLDEKQINVIKNTRPNIDIPTLNPSMWRKNSL